VTRRLAAGEVDIFHFSGHAVFGGGATGQIGFLFPEGMLGPDALSQTLAGAAVPPVVFANGCYTGRALGRRAGGSGGIVAGPTSPSTPDSGLGARLSLPSAFIGAGARMYLGCLWQVETEAAARFAVAFYRQLLRGETAGDALSRARKVAANYWMTHAAYVMYGDPRMRLSRHTGDR
ncbi:MAG: CHAT domain-containing protein, partial [Candidatus Wallbacteria bacterium]|nr:CHAT domain-containing protein [Candidatus Wallbacteria bacterium]